MLAIVDGDGNRVLYASLGARLLLERPARPPSELLDAIRTSPAAGIVLLPNDPGLQVVAEYAAQAAPVPVHVVPSRGLAQGLAALVAYRTDQSAAVLARRVRGGCRVGGQRRGAGGGGDDVAALRDAVAPRARARLARSSRCWPGATAGARTRSTRSRPGCAVGPPGRRARAARGRTGAPALLRER